MECIYHVVCSAADETEFWVEARNLFADTEQEALKRWDDCDYDDVLESWTIDHYKESFGFVDDMESLWRVEAGHNELVAKRGPSILLEEIENKMAEDEALRRAAVEAENVLDENNDPWTCKRCATENKGSMDRCENCGQEIEFGLITKMSGYGGFTHTLRDPGRRRKNW